jgi:hypothetical protein
MMSDTVGTPRCSSCGNSYVPKPGKRFCSRGCKDASRARAFKEAGRIETARQAASAAAANFEKIVGDARALEARLNERLDEVLAVGRRLGVVLAAMEEERQRLRRLLESIGPAEGATAIGPGLPELL